LEQTVAPGSSVLSGKDLYAAKRDDLGSFLYVVEAKRYSPSESVGVRFVRSLYGVVQQERATAGLLITTSYFTQDARRFQETVEHQISLRDYAALVGWLSRLNNVGN
ncbi:MAG TPA: restriction endonuclease, partial [Candidatus Limnocylindria bacterium]